MKYFKTQKCLTRLLKTLFLILTLFLTNCNSSKDQKNNIQEKKLDLESISETLNKFGHRKFYYTEDKSDSITLKVYLNYDKEIFELILKGEADSQREKWDSSFVVSNIIISKVENNSLKRLNFQNKPESTSTYFNISELIVMNYKNKGIVDFIDNKINFTDYNFDSLPDLGIYNLNASGNGGDIYYTWLYDSENESFKFDSLLSNASIGSINLLEKTISLHWKTGICDDNTWIYKVENDSFRLIKEISHYSETDSLGQFDCKEEIKNY